MPKSDSPRARRREGSCAIRIVYASAADGRQPDRRRSWHPALCAGADAGGDSERTLPRTIGLRLELPTSVGHLDFHIARVNYDAPAKALGITLPAPPAAIGIYVPAVRVGSLLFVSGHGPANLPDGTRPLGKVGRDLTLEQGKDSARRVGLNVLTSVQTTMGSLDRVVRVVKVLGMVNVAPDFTEMPQVING
ncbi:MAG: RidA family protein, partial [Acidobacteria bacterium]|nr:RidA family protein [Acidobacteriota bacterium]